MPRRCTRAPNLKLSICVYVSTKNKQAKQKQQTFDVFFFLLDDTNLLEEYGGKKERHKEYN